MKQIIALILILITSSVSANTLFNSKGRAGKLETTFGYIYQDANIFEGTNGSYADFDRGDGIIFGFGYNYTSRLAVGMEFSWVSPTLRGESVRSEGPDAGTSQAYRSSADIGRMFFTGTFNLLEGDFTPFVSAKFGWRTIDSNIPNGYLDVACYWDYWYGYICPTYLDTYSETDWGYGLSGGLRWDFNRNWFVKFSVTQEDFDTLLRSEDPNFLTYSIEIGNLL